MSYPVTDRFKTKVLESHQFATKVEVLVDDAVELTLTTVTEGQVTEDREADGRRRLTLTCVDDDGTLTPKGTSDLLAPYAGHEIKVYRGLVHDAGDVEYVPLGIYPHTRAHVQDTGPSLSIHMEGTDRTSIIKRARFLDTWVITNGTPVQDAVMALVQDVNPDWQMDMSSEDETLPKLVYDRTDDRLEALQKIVESCGCEFFFDPDGVFIMRPKLTHGLAEPEWSFVEGETCTILYIERRFELGDPVYNYVVVTGENTSTGAPIRAVAFDDDPESPTYVSTFGVAPFFITNRGIKTQGQADKAAVAQLSQLLGVYEQVDWLFVPNPAMQVDDVVSVTRERVGLSSEILVIDQVSIPLVNGRGMQTICRQRPVPRSV